MISNGEIPLPNIEYFSDDRERYLHSISSKTGIVFGSVSSFLFINNLFSDRWTEDEKLKLLLFETLLFFYITKNKTDNNFENNFLDSLIDFYTNSKNNSSQNFFSHIIKKDKYEQIETILKNRINISTSILDNKRWFKTINNILIYLDVILYHNFINKKDTEIFNYYDEYVYNTLVAILIASQIDAGRRIGKENVFQTFLNSASMSKEFKEKIQFLIKNGVSYKDFTNIVFKDELFCLYLIDLSLLTVLDVNRLNFLEYESIIIDLANFILPKKYDLDESMYRVENFILHSNDKNSFLTKKTVYEKIFNNFLNRWTKIILRNKDKLSIELSESKELISLIKKSMNTDLSVEEKEKVRNQFVDVVKSIPAVAIFMLPGGAVLMFLILKLLPDLIPSAFRDNEIEK